VARQAGKQPSSAPYPIVLAHHSNGDGPEWRATVEELPGCEARGATPESAAAAHSGKLLVRMPRSLHAELTRASEREGTSLNGYIVAALSASVAWRRAAGSDQRLGPAEERAASPGLTLALKANLVVLALAAVIAIALLITAWAG
jgi:hypothetical protein